MTTEIHHNSITADLTHEDVQRAFANHILRSAGVTHANIKAVNIKTIKDADPPTFKVEIIAENIQR